MAESSQPSLIELPPDHPDLPLKPPFIFVWALVIGLAVDWLKPMPARPDRWGGLGIVFVVFAVGLIAWAARTMRQRNTAVRPWKPTTTIVEDGPFALTRNPIYLGFALVLVGIGLWTDKLAVLLMTVPAIAATNSWVIAREESYLKRKFGAPYEAYLARVRRWV